MKKQFFSFQTKYKICLWRTYFETGYALTNYLKYPLLLVGITSKISTESALLYGFLYGVACFLIGYFWYRSDFIGAQIEVSNNYNKFVREMRRKIK